MKRVIFLCLIALGTLFASCGSDDDTMGDWSKAPQFPGVPRCGATSFTIDNVVYVGLGYNNDNGNKTELNDFWKFEDGKWYQIASFPGEPRLSAVAFDLNGKGYVGTGYQVGRTASSQKRFKDFWVYDPATDQWSELAAEFPGEARRDAVAFSLNNKGYVGTGSVSKSQTVNDFYSFDGTKWESISFPGDKREGASAFVVGGNAYVCLGKSTNYVTDLFKFDGTNWTKMRIMRNATDEKYDDDYNALPRAYAVAFIADLHGRPQAYIAGGSNGSTLSTCWEYDWEKDLWDEVTPLPSGVALGRVQAVGFSVKTANATYGYITTGAGSVDNPGYDDTWMFTPGIDEDENNDY